MSPGGPGAPQAARGLRGRGSVQRNRWGASSQEGRFNGLSFVGECVYAPRTQELLCRLVARGRRCGVEQGAAKGEQTLTAAGGGEVDYQPPCGGWRSGAAHLVAGFRGWAACLAVSSGAGEDTGQEAPARRRIGAAADTCAMGGPALRDPGSPPENCLLNSGVAPWCQSLVPHFWHFPAASGNACLWNQNKQVTHLQ